MCLIKGTIILFRTFSSLIFTQWTTVFCLRMETCIWSDCDLHVSMHECSCVNVSLFPLKKNILCLNKCYLKAVYKFIGKFRALFKKKKGLITVIIECKMGKISSIVVQKVETSFSFALILCTLYWMYIIRMRVLHLEATESSLCIFRIFF